MKINIGQIIFMVIAVFFSAGLSVWMFKEQNQMITYTYITNSGKVNYIHSSQKLFFVENTGCIESTKKKIVCDVKAIIKEE